MAELLGGSKDKIVNNNAQYIKRTGVGVTAAANDDVDDDKSTSTVSTTDRSAVALGHPSLPSVDIVSNTADRFISELPPFVTMSSKDSAPQIKLESPPAIGSGSIQSCSETTSEDLTKSDAAVNLYRKLVVKGGMKGYRMSRATHGVSSGCYFYEAIILGSFDESDNPKSCDKRGTKRPLRKPESIEEKQLLESRTDSSSEGDEQPAQKSNTNCVNGHLRIGWSTRLANLQAPVGYNQQSYAIRDIMGSRIHNSHRSDKWGGVGFYPGDVLGVFIYLVNGKSPTKMPKSISFDDVESMKDNGSSCELSEGIHKSQLSSAQLKSHIRFFRNGKPMGNDNGIGFDNILPGTYHPAVSCYMEGSAWLNFGPNFVYPPHQSMHLPPDMSPRPVSDLSPTPPLPEDVVETVISGGSSGKRGGHLNLTRRADEAIVSAFKELIGIEAATRQRAHLKHLELQKLETFVMRKERGLSTLDLV